jgi:hypothetical protein
LSASKGVACIENEGNVFFFAKGWKGEVHRQEN